MKSFAVTLALALLVGAVIVCNCIYINNVGTRMEESIRALPEKPCQESITAMERIKENWEHAFKLIHLSVNHNIVDRLGEQIDILKTCAECGDFYGYVSARTLLLDLIEDMRRLEGVGGVL